MYTMRATCLTNLVLVVLWLIQFISFVGTCNAFKWRSA